VGKYLDLIQSTGLAASNAARATEPVRSAHVSGTEVPASPTTRRHDAPDSRSPLIPEITRAKIEAIESEARRLGWPAELLWNSEFWRQPRGLAAILGDDDEIVAVTADHIEIFCVARSLLRFNRRAS
jgi:hypothetical protein